MKPMLSNEELEYNKAFFGEEQAPETEETVEEEKEEVIEEETEEPKEEVEEQQEEVVEEVKEEEPKQEEKRFKINWNGEDIEVSEEEAIKLAQKGYDYTFKTQALSKYKKQFEAMEQAGIKDDDIELLKKIKTGDKEALAFLAKNAQIDPYEILNIENPKVTLQNEPQGIVISDEVKPLIEQVSHDEALLNKLQQAETMLPDAVIRAMGQSSEMFYGLVSEIQTGTFYDVMPQLQRRMATMSDLDRAYVLQNPHQFATLYIDVKNTATKQSTPPQIIEIKKEKPNMAEVGIKKSTVQIREEAVLKDAFNSDDEYQRILNKIRNQG